MKDLVRDLFIVPTVCLAALAIICVTTLEVVALWMGHNGQTLAASIGCIGVVFGWVAKTTKDKAPEIRSRIKTRRASKKPA